MAMTEYARHGMLNHLFRGETFDKPSTVYIALFQDGEELSGNGYERQEITFSEPSGDKIENDEEIRFPIATGDWGDIDEGGIFDAETGGNRLDETEALAVRTVKEDDQYILPPGNVTIEVK